MERGHGHRATMWARRGDVAVILAWSCKKGRSLLSAPQAKRRECVWPWGAKKALGDLWSSALGVPGGTVQVNACQEPHERSALPGTHPRPCQPSPWGGSMGRAKPSCPSPCQGSGSAGSSHPLCLSTHEP